jgi:ABC-type uncharacterized transport system substrate-binding protein
LISGPSISWAISAASRRFAEIGAEFVRLKVDVIVTSGTPAVVAAKNATTVIPIVFGLVGDPVAIGLVASLSHPGGNVTGLSVQTDDVIGKRFDLLRQIVPSLRRLAVFANMDSALVLLEARDFQARPARSASKSPSSMCAAPRTSSLRLQNSIATPTRSMFVPTRS